MRTSGQDDRLLSWSRIDRLFFFINSYSYAVRYVTNIHCTRPTNQLLYNRSTVDSESAS